MSNAETERWMLLGAIFGGIASAISIFFAGKKSRQE